jgi:tetratricopeptide (TPR) repeat protein
LTGLVALVLSTQAARAQQAPFSAQTFLEPMVEAYGPKYQDVDTAIERLRAGNVAGARDSLKIARQKNPDLPPANTMLAQILFRFNQGAAGRSALEQAAVESPEDPAAYVYLGELAYQGRRLVEAKMLYEKGQQLADRYTTNDKRKKRLLINLHGGFASIAEVREDWAEAKKHLEALKALDPNNVVARTRLGRVIFKMAAGDRQQENQAYREFQQLHKIDSKTTAHPDVNMALLYENAGRRANAKTMMNNAATRDGENIQTRLAVTKWAMEANEMAMAKENADAALALDGNSLQAKLLVGVIARFNNDLPAAETAFKQAHLQAPTNLDAITQLTLVLVGQDDEKKRQEALEYARLNARIYSDLTKQSGREAAVSLGWVLSRLGENAAAVRTVQQAINAGSISADSSYHAAQILFDSGLTDLAGKILSTTLQSDTVFPNRTSAEQLLAKIRNG